MDRRQLLTVLAVGSLTACARRLGSTPAPLPAPAPHAVGDATQVPVAQVPVAQVPVALAAATQSPAPTTGAPLLVSELPEAARLAGDVALTIDDGFNPETVAAYVEFATATGTHLTFNPNGMYAPIWDRHASALRPLIEAGQVQIGNHTFSHKD